MNFETLLDVAKQLDRIAETVATAKKFGTTPSLDEQQLRAMAERCRLVDSELLASRLMSASGD